MIPAALKKGKNDAHLTLDYLVHVIVVRKSEAPVLLCIGILTGSLIGSTYNAIWLVCIWFHEESAHFRAVSIASVVGNRHGNRHGLRSLAASAQLWACWIR